MKKRTPHQASLEVRFAGFCAKTRSAPVERVSASRVFFDQILTDPKDKAFLIHFDREVEMLEDLITAAINECGRRADEAMKSNVQGMMGGLNLPGLT